MSGSLQERKHALMLKRTRERLKGVVVERFFSGDANAYRWADPISEERSLSPTFRLWITEWSAVQRLAAQLESTKQVLVRFGSVPDVGGVVVTGGTVCARLEAWIGEDSDLIRLRDPMGRWEVSLDVYESEEPRLALVAAGKQYVDTTALGEGTEPWRWDFLPPKLNEAVSSIKSMVLADGPVDQDRLRELLGGFGLDLRDLEPRSGDACAVTFAVRVEPSANRSYDDLRRALFAEVPDLVVRKEPR